MVELSVLQLIIPAFIAGLIMFLAPCTFPLIPGYLGFISGVSLEDLKDPEKVKAVRGKVFLNGVMFVLGFSLVFIIFGTLAGLLGTSVGQFRTILGRIGGIFVIVFGLYMLNVVKIPFLAKERRFKTPKFFKQGKPTTSFVLGTTFGIGWTPCAGPIIGSIVALAAASSTALQGGFLLAVFSLGLAVPFLLIAIGIGHAGRVIRKISRYLKVISFIGGLFLIFMGILLVTDSFLLWFSFAYKIFGFLNYEAIYNYL